MKWLYRVLGALAAFVLLAVAAAYGVLWSSLPQTSGRVTMAGLGAEVEVIRDAHGVPHIFAANEFDAFQALGFLHAQDRLFQMDFMRLSALGRLSEYLGPVTLDADRFMRAMNVAARTAATYDALDANDRRLLDAYAAGVNAYLQSHSGAWPPEFLAVGRAPEPWQPRDSLLWGKLMAIQLSSNWRDEAARARLTNRLTPAQLAQLWPEWPADAATTLAALADLYRSVDFDRFATIPSSGPAQASNEWALAGARTRSGKPLLANDPHLMLNAPGVWYLARIETPAQSLVGATAPGVPAIVLGHNRAIAWGFTTTNADTHDLFIEQIDPNDSARYVTPEGTQPFATRTETIRVKGQDDIALPIRSTRHGVVLSDLAPSLRAVAPDRHVVALAMPGFHAIDRTPASLFALNRARNWDEFVAALKDWQAPIQNVIYADANHIGLYTPGLVPLRRSGDGWLPRPGWTGEYDWTGFAPFAALPQVLDPAAGRLANANNRIVPPNYPVFISRDYDAPYRAQRIVERLDATPSHDLSTMVALQADSVSLFAREMLPRMATLAPGAARAQQAIALLRAWDGTMRRDRPEPLIFNAWMRELTSTLLTDTLGEQAPDFVREYPALLRAAFDGDSPYCGDSAGCEAKILDALDRALDFLARGHGNEMTAWRWGAAHFAPFRHPLFSRIPVVRDLLEFHIATDGDYFTVNRGATRGSDPVQPFAHVHGAGLRAVYDLGNLDASVFMIAPGQSGHPLSRHWGDLAQPWADGQAFPLRGERAALRASGAAMILIPR